MVAAAVAAAAAAVIVSAVVAFVAGFAAIFVQNVLNFTLYRKIKSTQHFFHRIMTYFFIKAF